MKKTRRLNHTDAYKKINLSKLKFRTTKDLEICKEMIGQQRATKSILFGLDIKKEGYNLYISGPPGLGKKTFIKTMLSKIAPSKPVPDDWCYLYNFENPKEPKAISLPAGTGKELKNDLEDFVDILRIDLPKAFESKDFEQEKKIISDKFNNSKEQLFKKLRELGNQNEIQIQFTPSGIVTVPLLKGNPVSHQQFETLEPELKNKLQEKKKTVDNHVAETLQKVRKIDKEYLDKIKELEHEVASYTVRGFIENLRDKYKNNPAIIQHLEAIQSDIASNIEKFLPKNKAAPMPLMPMSATQPEFNQPLNEYKVNVFIDNSNTKGAPIVFESQPHYLHLFGTIERELVMGAMVTNFTLIRDGAICKANGGYLVVEALDILRFPFVWDTLKKVLENGELSVEDMYQQYGYSSGVGLRPEPIKIDTKVIMIGPSNIYHMLYAYDPDFKKLFKIKADFDSVVKKNGSTLSDYACVIKSICEKQNLMDLDKGAVARVMEHSSRIAGDQNKLSVQFGKVDKILVEANYWALKGNSKLIKKQHVEKAIDEKIYRSSLIEEKIKEVITDGTIMIATKGNVVGQINGLSVYNLGDYTFGKPSRITCETFMGTEGVVNIERKARLSGNIHDKGVMILSGYLGNKFAQNKPLSLSASIGFEQSYDMIDGDSASAAELIVLLSSLADIPIKQSFAITGSVNQKGMIQPIGGVNEKIEGFYDICKTLGLTGDQGVIIPHQNVKNLMLKNEVVTSIKEKKFHIYPIKTINEGIEVLTGLEASEKKSDGNFKKGTFNYLVNEKLRELATKQKQFGKMPKNSESNDPKP